MHTRTSCGRWACACDMRMGRGTRKRRLEGWLVLAHRGTTAAVRVGITAQSTRFSLSTCLPCVQALAMRTTKPLVVVLVHNGPIDISELQASPRVGAIVSAWCELLLMGGATVCLPGASGVSCSWFG